ncbi:hypothetical protein [Streptomyces sp. TRM49041]|nr:hypothetical protein [Streptomyces sp. TRM49041]
MKPDVPPRGDSGGTPFPFTGGTIDKVDVSGDLYADHEAEVRGWFMND